MRARLLAVEGININKMFKILTFPVTGFFYYICPVLVTVIFNKG